jgi:hypothetical protein
MCRTSLLPLTVLAAALLVPASASAVEIKNFRPCYMPVPYGATRQDVKCLPGDYIFFTYDIEGLKFDEKTGKASFVTILELFDAKATLVFKKETPNEVIPQLGGTRMPGDLHIQMGRKQAPGKYIVRVTVHDRNAKEAKSHTHQFELLPQGFGFAGVSAPAIGFSGQHHATHFALIDMALDAKKTPNVKVEMRVLDENGKPVAPSMFSELPRDLPLEADLEKENFVPMHFPLYLNRPGRFTIDIMAKDNTGNKEARLTYPLVVLDFVTGK